MNLICYISLRSWNMGFRKVTGRGCHIRAHNWRKIWSALFLQECFQWRRGSPSNFNLFNGQHERISRAWPSPACAFLRLCSVARPSWFFRNDLIFYRASEFVWFLPILALFSEIILLLNCLRSFCVLITNFVLEGVAPVTGLPILCKKWGACSLLT